MGTGTRGPGLLVLAAVVCAATVLAAPAVGGALEREAPRQASSPAAAKVTVNAIIRVGGVLVDPAEPFRRVAKRAARRSGVGFRAVGRMVKETKRKAKRIKRSRAYRDGRWQRVWKLIELKLAAGAKACAVAAGVTLVRTGSLRRAISSCVFAFAAVVGARAEPASARSSARAVPALVAAALRVGVPAAYKLGRSIVSRGGSAAKTAAKAAARRAQIPFKRIKRTARSIKDAAGKIMRSAAFRNKKWRRVLRKVKRYPLYKPVRNCLIAAVAAYWETRSWTKTAVACVVGFATALRVAPATGPPAPEPGPAPG